MQNTLGSQIVVLSALARSVYTLILSLSISAILSLYSFMELARYERCCSHSCNSFSVLIYFSDMRIASMALALFAFFVSVLPFVGLCRDATCSVCLVKVPSRVDPGIAVSSY